MTDGGMMECVYPLQCRHNERGSVSNRRRLDYLLNILFRRRSKKTSKFRVTGLCEGNSPVTREFPAQRTSNAENVSIWWRHYDIQDALVPNKREVTDTSLTEPLEPYLRTQPKGWPRTEARGSGWSGYFNFISEIEQKDIFTQLENNKAQCWPGWPRPLQLGRPVGYETWPPSQLLWWAGLNISWDCLSCNG